MGRFSVAQVEAATQSIDRVFLGSPQFECEALNEVAGCRVVLKVETINPIRSFKGRGADLLVQRAGEPLVCASAGNFGQALAYSARKRALPVTVFAGTAANPRKVQRMRDLGATVVQTGEDFDAAKRAARDYASRQKLRWVEDGLDIETAIGAGTIALEVLQGPVRIDDWLVPVGNGALVNGIGCVVKARTPAAAVVGVQAAGAPAMIESWRQKTRISYPRISTIADGIGVREPVPEALADMEEVLDEGMLVSDGLLLRAMRLLFEVAGLVTEPSGAAAVAAVLSNPARFKNRCVAAVICGSNLNQELQAWLGAGPWQEPEAGSVVQGG